MRRRNLSLLILALAVLVSPYTRKFFTPRLEEVRSPQKALTLDIVRTIFPQAHDFSAGLAPEQGVSVFDAQKTFLGKVLTTDPFVQEKGYGGVVHLLIALDSNGKIRAVRLLSHQESPDVIRLLEEKRFFKTWTDTIVAENKDRKVDVVTGATLTSQAIINAVRKRLAMLEGRNVFGPWPDQSPKAAWKDFLVVAAVLFSFFVFMRRRDSRHWRNAALFLNVAILGFLSAKMLSVFLFYDWSQGSRSLLDVVFAVAVLAAGTAFVTNRDFYCQYVCPFGALQELARQASPFNIPLPVKVAGVLRFLSILFWAALAGSFMTGIFTRFEHVEPFAAFLNSAEVSPGALAIFFVFLVAAFFIDRIWCRFLCPTGRVMGLFCAKEGKDSRTAVVLFVVVVVAVMSVAFLGGRVSEPKTISAAMPPPAAQAQHVVAQFFARIGDKIVECRLCPHRCFLRDGEVGFCRARKNIDGTLYALTYGRPVALHIDPIEKKPFAHVYPGTTSFSLAAAGCNLRCKFCQNWEISQMDADKVEGPYVSPSDIVAQAKASGARTIAFTYTEPVVFYEYLMDIAREANAKGMACVMHSAGFIADEPLRQMAKYLLAANIDLKGFDEKFYTTFTQGGLSTVLETLTILKKEGVWVEITNLLIPGVNDTDEMITKLCTWVKDNLGAETPVHFSRFYPMYKLVNLSPTPVATLTRAHDIAKREGLKFVYIGNVPDRLGEDTVCPVCGKLLIKRVGYQVLENNIAGGKCPSCGYVVPGIWN